MINKSKSFYFKLIVTLAFIVFFLMWDKKEQVFLHLKSADPLFFLGACFLNFVAHIILFFRWQKIINSFLHININSLIPSYFIGVFSNNFLPTNIGGDIVRISYLKSQGLNLRTLFFGFIIDRYIGVFVCTLFCTVTGVAFYFINGFLNFKMTFLTLLVLLIVLISVYLIISKSKLKWFESNILIKDFCSCLAKIESSKHTLLKTISLTVFSTTFIVFSYFLLANAVELKLSLIWLFFIIPVSFFSAFIPTGIGGVGFREGTIVYLLTLSGANLEQSVSLNILYLFVIFISTSPGAVFIFINNRKKKYVS